MSEPLQGPPRCQRLRETHIVHSMSDSYLRCGACDQLLDNDDLFCSRCGLPTSINVNAQVTIADEEGLEASRAAGGGKDIIPDEPPPPGQHSTVRFNDRLRQILGDEFELLSLVGHGGFARVYKARDRRLDRVVAIKVIQPDMAGTERYMDIFRREGVALANLRHPGIVPIYDIRERGGLIYYIMPFVRGTTLDRRLDQSRLPPFESRRILSEITDALAAAHQAMMVHLDIKPENVFLEGELQKALLLDFGIAVAVAELVPESGGPIAGTPSYMSPEQARGLPDIDHRSDIYSLGALGYRMIMGRPPYVASTIEEVIELHAGEPPVPIRDINPSVPRDFADAIMKCLEKDPWNRFATAKELGTVLQNVTFNTPRDTSSAQVSSGVSGTTVALIIVLALLVGIIAGQLMG